jgi:predicted flap endonuclease-1-like 5' DNA nuclease
MRLDYMLYVLGAILLIITVVPFVTSIVEGTTETSVWVVATVVLGLFSIGVGYTQKPKTAAQSCQPVATMETPKEETTEVPMEKPVVKEAPTVATPATVTMELTQVKGIGEKRAKQLKALGINSVDELASTSAKTLAKKLKVSPKIVDKWVESAKELIK